MEEQDTPKASDTAIKADEICRKSGYTTTWVEDPWNNILKLQLQIPNGRYFRLNVIDDEAAAIIVSQGIPPATLLGDYDAILYKDTLEIEASIRDLAPFADRHFARSLSRIPGVELWEASNLGETIRREFAYWSLPIVSPDKNWSAEIGGPSARFRSLSLVPSRRQLTLKIRGVAASPLHDDAVDKLEEIGQSILFELDLRYNVTANLTPISLRARARRVDAQGKTSPAQLISAEVSSDRPSLPRNSYPANPLALYRYARSATNMPLLQFLAFYQVLEYYFISYFQSEILARMKQELLDPRFSVQDESHLARLAALAKSTGRGFATEKEQLRATVRACASNSSLADYLAEPVRAEFFTGKQPIKGLTRIDPKAATDIRDQVADRIYDIRCRIVHSKSESTEYPDLILPFSVEAQALEFDIGLVRYLSQRILISRAEPLNLP